MKIVLTRDDIVLDSPEEALFYGLCRLHEIPVKRTRLDDYNSAQANDVWYSPGFRIDRSVTEVFWIEVADGEHEAVLRLCRDAFRQSGRRLAVLYREELRTLMFCMNGHVIEQQLRTWAR